MARRRHVPHLRAMRLFAQVIALATLALAHQAAAYAPAGARPTMRVSAVAKRAAPQASVFESAMASFDQDYPEFSKRGFGPTTKAERWNGRHAMFGWVAIVATGYAQSHGARPRALCALVHGLLALGGRSTRWTGPRSHCASAWGARGLARAAQAVADWRGLAGALPRVSGRALLAWTRSGLPECWAPAERRAA
jgi:hypothetical protein